MDHQTSSPSLVGDRRKHLDPSELGTKEYWDSLYTRELSNHADDGEDEGTIWFDESNAEATVVRELDQLAEEDLLDQHTVSFLDLGTGNGHMLFALRYPDPDPDSDSEDDDDHEDGEGDSSRGWQGAMVGVDYSAASIDLARRIAAQRHDRDGATTTTASNSPLRFETWDLLTQSPDPDWLPSTGTFDVVLDKGTFDAISLMPTATGGQQPCATYRSKVVPLVQDGGFLVVTSCNWTRDELVEWLAPADGPDGEGEPLEVFREATYPSFTFGGKKGQSVVTLIFRRRNSG